MSPIDLARNLQDVLAIHHQLQADRDALYAANQDIADNLYAAGESMNVAENNNDDDAYDAAVLAYDRAIDDYEAVMGPIDQELQDSGRNVYLARMAIADLEL